MLVAKGLRKQFGERVAVDDVGFEIGAGEIFGLLGPNGAGKTTTISMLCGILPRDAGCVEIDGVDLDSGPEARARIGIVTQTITIYPDLTGRENLAFWGRMYGLRGAPLETRVEEALEAVGLSDRADDRVHGYSGGMQRRINLVAGTLHRPAVLVLDEPTTGVDPHSRSKIFELIESFRDRGMALLYTTHYMEEAERLCSRIGIMDHGRVIAEGTREELISRVGGVGRASLRFADPGARTRAAATLAAEGLEVREEDELLVAFLSQGPEGMSRLWSHLHRAGLEPASVEFRAPNLEDVFLTLTGRGLRD